MNEAESTGVPQNTDERYRQLIDAITDYAIYTLDSTGIVVSWNPGAERFKGYRSEEILGRHFSMFYMEEDRANELPRKALAAARAEGRFEGEGWRLRKDGTRFFAHVIIDPIHGPDGALIGFAKITRDITEARETQLLLAQTREALFLSQKMEAIGQVTGGAAHDFNNLLSAILGSLHMLRKHVPLEPRNASMLDNAIQSVLRGTELTQRMLAFARRQPMQTEVVDLAVLVAGMRDLLEKSIGPAITLRTDLLEGLRPVRVVPNQLELALLNLATNSRDAMPDGGVIDIAVSEVAVDTHHPTGLPPANYLCLSVTDTGCGMDAATLAQARKSLFTTKPPGKGTGLGLAIVQSLADQHRGHLHIESHSGVGTRIELWLPAACGATATTTEQPLRAAPLRSSRLPLRLLVVDDDDLVLFSTAALLEDLNHTVIQAGSGHDALSILQRDPAIDLVITDYAMPRMSGLQFAEQAQVLQPHLPLIVVSGYADLPHHSVRNIRMLLKPFSQEDLVQAIGDAMGNAEP